MAPEMTDIVSVTHASAKHTGDPLELAERYRTLVLARPTCG